MRTVSLAILGHVEDAEAVIALMQRSLEQVGIDVTTGELDIDMLDRKLAAGDLMPAPADQAGDLVVVAAADMVSMYIRGSIVPLVTPDDQLGRVTAVEGVFIGASNELGEFRAGVMAAWTSAVFAVTCALTLAFAAFVPSHPGFDARNGVELAWQRRGPSLCGLLAGDRCAQHHPVVEHACDIGLAALPEGSIFASTVAEVRAIHSRHPDPKDWRAARAEISERYYLNEPAETKTIFNANLNGAMAILALLYGDGDFRTTLDMSCALGFDAGSGNLVELSLGPAEKVLGLDIGRNGLVAFPIQPLEENPPIR